MNIEQVKFRLRQAWQRQHAIAVKTVITRDKDRYWEAQAELAALKMLAIDLEIDNVFADLPHYAYVVSTKYNPARCLESVEA